MQSEKAMLDKILTINDKLNMMYRHLAKYSLIYQKRLHSLSDCWTFKSGKVKAKIDKLKWHIYGYECFYKQLVWCLAGGLYEKRTKET